MRVGKSLVKVQVQSPSHVASSEVLRNTTTVAVVPASFSIPVPTLHLISVAAVSYT